MKAEDGVNETQKLRKLWTFTQDLQPIHSYHCWFFFTLFQETLNQNKKEFLQSTLIWKTFFHFRYTKQDLSG